MSTSFGERTVQTLTMLSKFHAMNKTNAHGTLPQSVSPKAVTVQRG